ncbi:MFS transporter [Amycolatopsis alba]|nr:MFS transporter [Amycolatopsis alba]
MPGEPMNTSTPVRSGLFLGHRGFRLLFTADAISQLGSQVAVVALPLIALTLLNASPLEIGLLTAAGTAAFAFVGLPAGAWVDRFRRRPVLVAADFSRFLLMGSVPIAALFGVLTLPHLYVVALLAGVATVFFDVASMSYVPSLVARQNLLSANARLEAVETGARAGGPALGGWLVQLTNAVVGIAVDAVSFLLSAVALARIRHVEDQPVVVKTRLRRQIAEGGRFVLRHPVLRLVGLAGFLGNFWESALLAVQPVFLLEHLGLGAGAYGLVVAAAGVGGLLGSSAASWAGARLGTRRTMWLPLVVGYPFLLLAPLAGSGWLVFLYPLGTFLAFFGGAMQNVAQLSYRQGICPPELLGRMNATMRFLIYGAMPLGGLAGGVLATVLGFPGSVWVIAAGLLLSILPMLAPAVRHLDESERAAA